jgi:hypothetical protein
LIQIDWPPGFEWQLQNKLPVAIPESHHAKPVIRPSTAEFVNFFDG